MGRSVKSQDRTGAALFRGFGEPVERSIPLSFVSKQPPRFRSAAVVLVSCGAAPAPSKHVAVPYPTRSTSIAPAGQPANAVALELSATRPDEADIAVEPVASGVGPSMVPAAPAA